ncbi:MAG: hypothetical protein EBY49_05670, partial [Actinobacteria bacterium]|nr:hypothetical protein [Actinomycetota bacterium]
APARIADAHTFKAQISKGRFDKLFQLLRYHRLSLILYPILAFWHCYCLGHLTLQATKKAGF